MNLADSDSLRPVLGPTGNTARSVDLRKPTAKLEKPVEIIQSKGKNSPALSPPQRDSKLMPCVLRKQQGGRKVFSSNLSMNASCSSDASSDSSHSRASTGRIARRSVPNLRRQSAPRIGRTGGGNVEASEAMESSRNDSLAKKRCAWVTSNTGICCICLLLFCSLYDY